MKIWPRRTPILCLAAALALLGSPHVGWAQADAQVARLNAAPERRKFIEMVRVSRLPAEEQKKNLASVYNTVPWMIDGAGNLSALGLTADAPPAGPVGPPDLAPEKTPEQIADGLMKGSHPGAWLSAYAKAIGRGLLLTHRDAATLLLNADFASGDENAIKRALLNLEQISVANEINGPSKADPAVTKWLALYFDEVLTIFQSDASIPLANQAAQVLGVMGEARAIDALVERDPQRPTLFFPVLEKLAPLAPPHPKIVEQLQSPDAKVRGEALQALGTRQELLPQYERLLRDPSPEVRGSAVHHIFSLGDEAVASQRANLVPLLQDDDALVRWAVAGGLARRKDAIAGPALLALLKDPATSPTVHAAVAQDVRTLTGSDWNFSAQDTKSRDFQESLRLFEAWIAEHPARPAVK